MSVTLIIIIYYKQIKGVPAKRVLLTEYQFAIKAVLQFIVNQYVHDLLLCDLLYSRIKKPWFNFIYTTGLSYTYFIKFCGILDTSLVNMISYNIVAADKYWYDKELSSGAWQRSMKVEQSLEYIKFLSYS